MLIDKMTFAENEYMVDLDYCQDTYGFHGTPTIIYGAVPMPMS